MSGICVTRIAAAACLWLLAGGMQTRARAQSPASLGIFQDHTDVGAVLHPGSAGYDAAQRTYALSGSGENMWFATDAFHFAWKRVSGDVSLTAHISFEGAGKEAHRKAVLMIRQSLDPDSAYADVARHGDGLTSLQVRDEKGANTTEIQSALKGPVRVRIAKRGDYFYIWVAGEGEELHFSGGSMRVALHDPFYVGLGVCSHNKDVVEKAIFSDVELNAAASPTTPLLYSTLETAPVSGDRRVVYVTPGRIESPEWSPDGAALLFKRDSHWERVPLAGGAPEPVQPNDHAAHAQGSPPLYTHLNRGGALQIWRRQPDGGEPEQITSGDLQNCFPQVSPDGRQIAFLSFPGSGAAIPEEADVMLRIMSLGDRKTRVLAKLSGGRGTLDGQPWSPDGQRLAYISYQRLVP